MISYTSRYYSMKKHYYQERYKEQKLREQLNVERYKEWGGEEQYNKMYWKNKLWEKPVTEKK